MMRDADAHVPFGRQRAAALTDYEKTSAVGRFVTHAVFLSSAIPGCRCCPRYNTLQGSIQTAFICYRIPSAYVP